MTERPESSDAGTVCLVGTNEEVIYSAFMKPIEDKAACDALSHARSPYGDAMLA